MISWSGLNHGSPGVEGGDSSPRLGLSAVTLTEEPANGVNGVMACTVFEQLSVPSERLDSINDISESFIIITVMSLIQ